jgi:hypothetical protein
VYISIRKIVSTTINRKGKFYFNIYTPHVLIRAQVCMAAVGRSVWSISESSLAIDLPNLWWPGAQAHQQSKEYDTL